MKRKNLNVFHKNYTRNSNSTTKKTLNNYCFMLGGQNAEKNLEMFSVENSVSRFSSRALSPSIRIFSPSFSLSPSLCLHSFKVSLSTAINRMLSANYYFQMQSRINSSCWQRSCLFGKYETHLLICFGVFRYSVDSLFWSL